MKLSELVSVKNNRTAKRLGRGRGSGKGQTSGRGNKGQKSRSGHNIPRTFEGGQTPLVQRLAKARGFKSRNSKPAILHIVDIEKHFSAGETVNFKSLLDKKLVKDVKSGVKIIGPGKLSKNLKFADVKLTRKLVEDSKKIHSSPSKKVIETNRASKSKSVSNAKVKAEIKFKAQSKTQSKSTK